MTLLVLLFYVFIHCSQCGHTIQSLGKESTTIRYSGMRSIIDIVELNLLYALHYNLLQLLDTHLTNRYIFA